MQCTYTQGVSHTRKEEQGLEMNIATKFGMNSFFFSFFKLLLF